MIDNDIIEEARGMMGDMVDKYLNHMPKLSFQGESIEVNCAYELLCGLEVIDQIPENEILSVCKKIAEE